MIKITSLSDLKDGCVSLRFIGDFVSAVSLWHKWAVKISYKKCRFATFARCLRIATALAHAHNDLFYYLSILGLVQHVTLNTRPWDRLRITENGVAGLGTPDYYHSKITIIVYSSTNFT